ncbi:type II toxin-antitoxin system prevent-host-death family antitoxin [Isoptericola sp. b515]|uniref:type II toxin-antitoxin system Phd/YefM family antitoxin n=1 Tax=Isoptericola sp. b515 TaxID=3064652 RepID=UPI00271341E9|nr:type II toxin-antitoxin system prevent-host-death family antitoxin [Isoptericola sp. b515]MDO8149249.1 type II toxin-antitoxin system prevent-host-death family antitoxin [Isoptericola sp. b515]
MDVPVSTLRAELKSWIERARAGEEVVITERGVPVARLTGVQSADLVAQLVRDGLVSPADGSRPVHEVPSAPEPTGPGHGTHRSTSGSALSGLVRRIRR